MAFKLGSNKGLQARGGDIKSKFKFKADKEVVPGVPVFKKQLGKDILAEANMDGTISETYDDNAVYYQGQVWPRVQIAGQNLIIDPSTGKKYKEGSRDLPWENNKI